MRRWPHLSSARARGAAADARWSPSTMRAGSGRAPVRDAGARPQHRDGRDGARIPSARAIGSARRCCGSCSPTTTGSGRGAAGAAAGAAGARRTSSSRSIAPDSNRSATARSITFRRPLWVERGRLRGRHERLRHRRHARGLRAARRARADRRLPARPDRLRHQPRLQPRRRHHLLRHGRGGAGGHRARPAGHRGLPAVARRARWTSGSASSSTSTAAAAFVGAGRRPARRRAAAEGTLLNINVPGGEPDGVEVARLGKRIYRDELDLMDEEDGGRRVPDLRRLAGHDDEPGTDLAAVAAGRIAVTPLHFDLTAEQGMEALRAYDLARAARAGRRGGRPSDASPRAGAPSCASSSPTTATATTSSTTPRSATTPTTRCSTSCARSRPSTRSCSRPTRRRSGSAASRSPSSTKVRHLRPMLSLANARSRGGAARLGRRACAPTSRARGSRTRSSRSSPSRRSTAWRSRCSTATACSSAARRAATARSARTSPTTCARSARSR